MTEKEFRKSTPEYFMLRLYGMNAKEDAERRERWEIARYMAARARTAMADKFPRGFWELPWDKKSEWTDEDWKEFNRQMDDIFPVTLGEA